MGVSQTRPSSTVADLPQGKRAGDSSSYVLGRKRSSLTSEPFDKNRLNFIPHSDRTWDWKHSSPSPRTPSLLHRPATVYSLPRSSRLYSYVDYPTPMPTDRKSKCDQCGMVFPSNDALFKHKTRFCIGVKDSGIGRKPVYSDDDDDDDGSDYHRHTDRSKRSTVRRVIRYPSPAHKKYDEVNDWKRQQSIRQTIDDMEDQLRLDAYRTRKLDEIIKQQDQNYTEILLEYERIQAQERAVLTDMYHLQPNALSTRRSNELLDQSLVMTDHLNGQLDDLRRRNKHLEEERRLIQGKLEELISSNYQPSSISNYEPYRFLREMKEQEELNGKALSYLQQRLVYPYSSLSGGSEIPFLPYVNHTRRSAGDDARDFRNSYLASGGHDPSLLAHYTDTEYRLRAYEDYPWTKDYPETLKSNRLPTRAPTALTTEPTKATNEDQTRLQDELDDIHQKFDELDSRTRQLESSAATTARSDPDDRQSRLSGKTDPHPRSQPSQQNPRTPVPLNNQQLIPTLEKRVTPRPMPAMNPLASNMMVISRDPFVPHSYDPVGGFVIFFDYILHLPNELGQCCLITCLHHPKSGLGEPSQFEPFAGQLYSDERNGDQINVGLIATKQPVPRCPPQQALTVVIEMQTVAGKVTSNDEFQTSAWTKLPLFDSKNRLLSGRWKVPLKSLPIQYDQSLAIISRLASYDQAELYYRLVNLQDADGQSNVSLTPHVRTLYSVPVQYRTRPSK